MKYSLRSLMVVVTLVCVVLGGRIEYLRRMAAYHEREATGFRQKLMKGSWTEHFRALGMAYHHERLASEYQSAIIRPWKRIDETLPPEDRGNENHFIDLPNVTP